METLRAVPICRKIVFLSEVLLALKFSYNEISSYDAQNGEFNELE